jgi:hypothetical protein
LYQEESQRKGQAKYIVPLTKSKIRNKMAFPRITAGIFVLILIGILSLAGIGAVQWIGPIVAHGRNVEHADGTIIAIGPGRNFTLKTAQQILAFQCGNQCRASLGHLQRHLNEKAHTDVYFMQGENNVLLVIDVD